MERNSVKQKSRPTPKGKVYRATAEILKINRRNLPQRLGLLLKNEKGAERWFTMWLNGGEVPDIQARDRIEFSYAVKKGRKGNFLNLKELQVKERPTEEESIGDEVLKVARDELRREVSIRVAVALKASAQVGWAKDGDDLFALANACYDWLKAKEEAEVANLLGEGVSEGGQGS